LLKAVKMLVALGLLELKLVVVEPQRLVAKALVEPRVEKVVFLAIPEKVMEKVKERVKELALELEAVQVVVREAVKAAELAQELALDRELELEVARVRELERVLVAVLAQAQVET
jgi:hypothetical protein